MRSEFENFHCKVGMVMLAPPSNKKMRFSQYAQLLATYFRPQWKMALVLAVLLFGGVGLTLVNPQIIRYFLDTVLAGGSMESLLAAGVAFIGIALVQQAFGLLASYIGGQIGWVATNRLRVDLAAHMLRLDMGFHKAHTPGELVERVDGGDVNALSNFFSSFVIQFAGNLALIAGVLALLYREDWRIGVTLTAFVAFALLTIRRMRILERAACRGLRRLLRSAAQRLHGPGAALVQPDAEGEHPARAAG